MTDRPPLTARQQEVLDFIENAIRTAGFPPSMREIGERLGITSTNGVSDHLKALERKGYLQRSGSKSRSCVPTRNVGQSPAPRRTRATVAPVPGLEVFGDDFVEVPVAGKIAAGLPIAALDTREDSVKIDRFFLGKNRDVFALRVVGDSMINDGIHDGDFIFVRKQQIAPRGSIVVAMIDGEATVKRFYHEGERIRFQPANDTMKPIFVKASEFKETHIVGVVVGIYRTMG
jgi:repressor LexA